jgi:hypothetical protein
MVQSSSTVFDRLVWEPDRMLLDDLVFPLQHVRSESWSGGEHFMFYKLISTSAISCSIQNFVPSVCLSLACLTEGVSHSGMSSFGLKNTLQWI